MFSICLFKKNFIILVKMFVNMRHSPYKRINMKDQSQDGLTMTKMA